MIDNITELLQKAIKINEGILAVIISDKDGVPLLKVADDEAPEMAMSPAYLSPFGLTTDSASKFGAGQNKSIISYYSNHQVIQCNKGALILTMLGTRDANTGMMETLAEQLDPFICQLTPIVEVS